jgi:hypothetical protein
MQLTMEERDLARRMLGERKPIPEIFSVLVKRRKRSKLDGPDLTSVRRLLKGKTHPESRVETRGKRRIYSALKVKTMNKVRQDIQKKVDGEREVLWEEIITKACAKKAHRTTAARSFIREEVYSSGEAVAGARA